MNKKILQLSNDAGLKLQFSDTVKLEKFANLVIAECIKILITGEGNDKTVDAIWDLEQLGVKVDKILDKISY